MATLNRIWQYNTISFASKFKLYEFLTSILLSGCKTWLLLAVSKKKKERKKKKEKIQAFETKCLVTLV